MSCGTSISLGVFTEGEVPAPLQYQYLDWEGSVIDLTGYSVRFTWCPRGGAATTGNGTLADAVNGKVQYTWNGLEFSVPGKYEAQFWVGNLTNKWASDLITWTVRSSIGTPPAI